MGPSRRISPPHVSPKKKLRRLGPELVPVQLRRPCRHHVQRRDLAVQAQHGEGPEEVGQVLGQPSDPTTAYGPRQRKRAHEKLKKGGVFTPSKMVVFRVWERKGSPWTPFPQHVASHQNLFSGVSNTSSTGVGRVQLDANSLFLNSPPPPTFLDMALLLCRIAPTSAQHTHTHKHL